MRCLAILLAGGTSERFGCDKLWLNLAGEPLWKWSYKTLLTHPLINGVGIVAHPSRLSLFLENSPEAHFVVPGGVSRQESSYNGLAASTEEDTFILFHDAARPFISHDLITTLIKAAERSGAACPGYIPRDTIKQRTNQGVQSLVREQLVCVQTPQLGKREHFIHAHAQSNSIMTDDVSLLENIGLFPEIIPGDPRNMKVTGPEDIHQLRSILEIQLETRSGLGYDIHPFSKDLNRPLYLGGVLFEGTGLEGHSDADVILHAVVDALLGAAGLGDIGQHYPNTDPQWQDVSSLLFLRETANSLRENRWQILNIDISVIAEHPKVMTRSRDMRTIIAEHLNIEVSRVNLKATTNEKLGAIGRSEGIAAFAVANIRKLF